MSARAILFINDFSRIARSTKDLLEIVAELAQSGVKLISLKENLDTSTPTGKLMLTMIGAINEFERNNLLDRQREGIAIAKQKGLYKGRKAISKPPEWDEIYNLYMTRKITGTAAIERLGLRRNTFYRFVKEMKESE
jgi:DNA invertase Pin-like site-specific DNA recombinase